MKAQDAILSHFKIIKTMKTDIPEIHQAVMDLDDILPFHEAVTGAVTRAIQDLTDSVFCSVANVVLLRRDAYLDNIKFGIKPDTLLALRSSPIQASTLFADDLILRAEQEVTAHENLPRRDRPGHPYKQPASQGNKPSKGKPAWKRFRKNTGSGNAGEKPAFNQKPAKAVNKK